MLTLTILIVTLIDMCVDTDNTDSDTNRHVLTLTILIVTLGMCVDTDNTDSDTNRHVC